MKLNILGIREWDIYGLQCWGGGHLPRLNGWGIYDLKGGAVMKKYIAVSFGPKKMLVFGGVPFLIIA